MSVIHVDCNALTALSSALAEQAASVSAGAAPPIAHGFPATSAAVQVVHGDMKMVAVNLAVRLQSTGAKVSNAAAGYADTELASARAIRALGHSATAGTVEV